MNLGGYFSDSGWGAGSGFPAYSRPGRRSPQALVNGIMAQAQREQQQEQARRAALHEAGHAFVLWTLRMPFAQLAINDHGIGHTARSTADEKYGPPWTARTAVLVLAAGAAGERLAYPDAHDGCDGDEERIARILADRPETEPGLRAEVDQLVHDGRATITAAADILLRVGRLSGTDAAAVFSKHATQAAAPTDTRAVATEPVDPEPTDEEHFATWATRYFRRGIPTADPAWSRPAIQAAYKMNRAADRGDWNLFRQWQSRLIDLQRTGRRQRPHGLAA